MLYNEADTVNIMNHVELSKCTILDAQAVRHDGKTHWAIHVNFTIPRTYNQPPNTTRVSLLEGANRRDHYFVNQTFPCYASTKDLEYVAFTPQKPDSFTVFGIVFLSTVSFIILVAILYVLHMIYVEMSQAVPTKSATEMVEQGMTVNRASFDSNESDLEETPLTGGRRGSGIAKKGRAKKAYEV
jgi:hypothetical protein